MRILVIAATNNEIEPFIAENKTAEILVTGIGIPATIYNLQKHLAKNSYDLVIQAGIAGAFNTNTSSGFFLHCTNIIDTSRRPVKMGSNRFFIIAVFIV